MNYVSMTDRVSFTDLPEDIFFILAGYLDREDTYEFRVTCKKAASIDVRGQIGVPITTYNTGFTNKQVRVCMPGDCISESIVESGSVNLATICELCPTADIIVVHSASVESKDFEGFTGTLVLHGCHLPTRFRFSGVNLILQECTFHTRFDRVAQSDRVKLNITFTQHANFIMRNLSSLRFEIVTIKLIGQLNVASVVLNSYVLDVELNANVIATNAHYIDGSACDLYFEVDKCIDINPAEFENFNALVRPAEIGDLCDLLEQHLNIGCVGGYSA